MADTDKPFALGSAAGNGSPEQDVVNAKPNQANAAALRRLDGEPLLKLDELRRLVPQLGAQDPPCAFGPIAWRAASSKIRKSHRACDGAPCL